MILVGTSKCPRGQCERSRKEESISPSSLAAFAMSTFAAGPSLAKAKSFDTRGFASGKTFVPLAAHGRASTFTGDADSLAFLRRRLVRSNFSFEGERSVKAAARPPLAAKVAAGQVVAIVDAFSTGACLAAEAAARGYGVVHALSLEPSDELAAMVPAHLRGAIPWLAEMSVDTRKPLDAGAAELAARLEAWCAARGAALVGVLAGAETGVKLADFLGAAIVGGGGAWAAGVRSNGAEGAEARRNKWDMGEKVRRAGVRAVRQLRSKGWDATLERWLREDWGLDPADDAAAVDLVVKPTESGGSDGVTACASVGGVRAAVRGLVGAVNALGQRNEEVLIQEFLRGDEYVVDAVSRDGAHKVVGAWVYDRRPTNGAGFVLHGQRFMASSEPVVKLLADYAKAVLDALDLRHGPSHMEVKLVPGSDSPCLVEVGARCHGAEGFWISVADECAGTNQARAALDAYVDAGAFAALAPLPPAPLLASGTIKFLLVHEDGTLDKIDDAVVRRIKALASYRGYEIFVEAGKKVEATRNCFSWGGVVKLNHADPQQVLDDYAFLDAICLPGGGLWTISA